MIRTAVEGAGVDPTAVDMAICGTATQVRWTGETSPGSGLDALICRHPSEPAQRSRVRIMPDDDSDCGTAGDHDDGVTERAQAVSS